jgi:hypothetical protein
MVAPLLFVVLAATSTMLQADQRHAHQYPAVNPFIELSRCAYGPSATLHVRPPSAAPLLAAVAPACTIILRRRVAHPARAVVWLTVLQLHVKDLRAQTRVDGLETNARTGCLESSSCGTGTLACHLPSVVVLVSLSAALTEYHVFIPTGPSCQALHNLQASTGNHSDLPVPMLDAFFETTAGFARRYLCPPRVKICPRRTLLSPARCEVSVCASASMMIISDVRLILLPPS